MLKSLLWIIPSYEKKYLIEQTDLDVLNELATIYGYKPLFVFITNNEFYTNIDNIKIATDIEYKIVSYNKKVYLNTAIMKELENADFDNVMVTNIKYTREFNILENMLDKSTIPNTDVVHVQKKKLGFFGEFTNLTKSLYNKIVKMFTNSLDNLYIRNCIIFNKLVLDIMKDFPNKSGIIMETTNLGAVHTEIVNVDNTFKKAKLKPSTISQFAISSIICLISLALFVIICSVKMNLDALLWVIILCITTGVMGVIFVNYAILQEKIRINNFNLEETKNIKPIKAISFNEEKQVITKDDTSPPLKPKKKTTKKSTTKKSIAKASSTKKVKATKETEEKDNKKAKATKTKNAKDV